MKDSKTKLVQIRVSEKEYQMVQALCDRFGSTISEYIRGLIRDKFAKAFPIYTKFGLKQHEAVEPEMTDEQFCEFWGGTVAPGEGAPMCHIKSGGVTFKMLLSDRAAIERNGKKVAEVRKLRG